MAVDSRHPSIKKYQDRWKLVRSIVDSDVHGYIEDVDVNDKKRNDRYKQRAILTNFTSRTKNALVGSVFREAPEIELPPQLEYLREDTTGKGLTLEQFAQEVVGEVLDVGRYGILVDYPEAEPGLTAAEVEQRNLAARLYAYKAENIINWFEKTESGKFILSMVVLLEIISEPGADGFEWEDVEQYRVLRMVNGVCEHHVYDCKQELISVSQPRKADGSTFNYIPFVFIGSENNDPCIDPLPLYDLAKLNLGHLYNSADAEEMYYYCAKGTWWGTTSASAEDLKNLMPQGFGVGSNRLHMLGEQGSLNLLQMGSDPAIENAMARKEEQAIMLGARLITPQGGIETAEAARIRYSSENSVLTTLVNNVSDGILRALQIAAEFMSANPDDIVFELNREFYDSKVDPQALMAAIQLRTLGDISRSDMIALTKKSGLVDKERTEEDIVDELNNENPLDV